MEISELMPILGGVASRRILVNVTSRKALNDALALGQIVRVAYGRYGVPGVQEGTRLALKVSGRVCLVSAALSHGWKLCLLDRAADRTTRSIRLPAVRSWAGQSLDPLSGP